jgi:hypothetical protein
VNAPLISSIYLADASPKISLLPNTRTSWYFLKWIPDQHYLLLTKINIETIFDDGILPSLKWRVVFQYFSVLGGRKEKKRKKKGKCIKNENRKKKKMAKATQPTKFFTWK